MKILIVTQWFEPEPTFKGLLLARELTARGHQVQVLTGFPNYPGGKLYPGYRVRLWQREVMEGIPVLRVALYPSHDHSAIRRVLNYASFAVSASVLGTLLAQQPDVLYAYHPPATVGLPAMVISALRRVPFVYDIQDLWPDTLRATGMVSNDKVLGLVGRFCKMIYRRAARISVLSPGFKMRLVDRGVPAEKIEVIYNWCDEGAMSAPSEIKALAGPGQFSILFAGTMGRAQQLESVLEAAQICAGTVPEALFFFVGGGIERDNLIAMVQSTGLSNVQFLPQQPMSAMGGILAGADVLLVHLKDDPLFRITVPSKTQAYLAAGKPVLIAVRGDAADLVLQSGGGLICEPGNPASIAEAVKALRDIGPEERAEMGQRGREYYQRELSVEIGIDRLARLMEDAVGGRKQAPPASAASVSRHTTE